MSRTLEASYVLPISLILLITGFILVFMSVISCQLASLAHLRLSFTRSRNQHCYIQYQQSPASLDPFNSPIELAEAASNSEQVLYLAFIVEDLFNLAKGGES
ncbi:MAG: hypothetical protein Q4P72_00995 [Eubacteriales bacterium]|nr:hypothetical protein [Eubacteriales bacterium]